MLLLQKLSLEQHFCIFWMIRIFLDSQAFLLYISVNIWPSFMKSVEPFLQLFCEGLTHRTDSIGAFTLHVCIYNVYTMDLCPPPPPPLYSDKSDKSTVHLHVTCGSKKNEAGQIKGISKNLKILQFFENFYTAL